MQRANGVTPAETTPASRRLLSGATTGRRLAIAAGLGVIGALGFAPYFLWPLMLVAFCGLLWLLDTGRGAGHAAACGWFFGLGHFAAGLYWISISFQFQADMPTWLGWVAVFFLSSYLAIWPALALWVASLLWSPSPARILVLAASWAAAEWLRGHLLTGFPWNMAAQVWGDIPAAMQSARVFGAYGLSLLTVALFASLGLIADRTAAARRALALAGALAMALLIDGWWRLRDVEPAIQPGLRLHLVQANVTQDLEADPRRQAAILILYESMTAATLRDRGPGIVVWPETAVEYDVEGDGPGRLRLARLVGQEGTLILGAVGQRRAADGSWIGSRNSLLAIDGHGAVRAVYDKARLVPFGEYLPGGGMLAQLGLTSLAAGHARFVAGSGPVTVAPGIPPFSPLICYEIIFPGSVADSRARPAWLLNISNDAWFGDSQGPHQHLAQARLRAVEEGLPVARSTPTGISAIIDPYGRLVARTALGEQAVLTGNVPAPLRPTLYSRMGDWPFAGLLSACVLIGGWARRARR